MAPDIDVVPFDGPLPLSRGASERRLNRTDRFDRRARVIGHETLTSTGTVRITFEVIDDEPWTFNPGHFVGIRADVRDAGSRRSPYCISSPPNDARTFRLLIRLVPQGPLSIYLGGLGVGDVITFRGPSGRSILPNEVDNELVLLATGVGLGPLLSFVQHVLPGTWHTPIRLFWGLRLAEDICLVDELDDLAGRCPNFSYQISLSQPPPAWTGLRGRLTESVPPLLPTLGGKHFYLVGNGAMVEELSSVLSDLGVDQRLIYEESYFNVRYRPDPGDLARIRSRFVASDLFSPYQHQQAGLFIPERPVRRR
jgi:ferredoxin-NADP reductase